MGGVHLYLGVNGNFAPAAPSLTRVGLARGGALATLAAFLVPAAAVAALFTGFAQDSQLLHTWLWAMVFAWAGAMLPCLLFTVLDLWGRLPKNPGNRYPTGAELRYYGLVVAGLLTVVTVPDFVQLWFAGSTPAQILSAAGESSWLRLVLEFLAILVAADLLTFAEHWLMHKNRWLWKNIHAVHHLFDQRGACLFSWAGIWVHPVEALVFLLAMIAVPGLLGVFGIYFVHPLALWAGLFIYVALVVEEHSGFDLPWSPHRWMPLGLGGGAAPHEVHHGKATRNYGFILKLWDFALGSYTPPPGELERQAEDDARRPGWSLRALTRARAMYRDARVRRVAALLALAAQLCVLAWLTRWPLLGLDAPLSLADLAVAGSALVLVPLAPEFAGLVLALGGLARWLGGPDYGLAWVAPEFAVLGLFGCIALLALTPVVFRDRIRHERVANEPGRRALEHLLFAPLAGPLFVAASLMDAGWRRSLTRASRALERSRGSSFARLPWRNWAQTVHAVPQTSRRPRELAELQAAIRDARARGLKVRVTGASYSWSSLCASADMLIYTEALDRVRMDLSDPEHPRVIAEAGATNYQINALLERHGYALESNVVLEVVRIGGVVGTGSHGSGWNCSTVSDYVHALELVDAEGEVRRFVAGEDDPDLLDALRVGLGACGVLWRITLDVVPSQIMRATEVRVDTREMLETVAERVPAAAYLDVFYTPGADEAWLRQVEPCTERPGFRRRTSLLSAIDFSFRFEAYRALGALMRWCPRLSPPLCRIFDRLEPNRGTRVLPLVDCVHYVPNIDSVPLVNIEVAFKLDPDFDGFHQAWDAFERLSAAYAERGLYPVNTAFNARFIAGSRGLLSPAQGPGHTCYVEVLAVRGTPGWEAFSAELGAAWMELPEAAPHWGKQWESIPGIDAHLRRRFGDTGLLARFRSVREQLDPTHMFSNPTLERVLGADQPQ